MPTDNKILNGSGLTTLVSLIKKDIDVVASTIPSIDALTTTFDDRYVNVAGDTMTGGLTITSTNGLSIQNQGVSTNITPDSIEFNSGSTVYGSVTMTRFDADGHSGLQLESNESAVELKGITTPVNTSSDYNNYVATKGYVDEQVGIMGTGIPQNVSDLPNDAGYLTADAATTTLDDRYVNASGDRMSGTLTFSDGKGIALEYSPSSGATSTITMMYSGYYGTSTTHTGKVYFRGSSPAISNVILAGISVPFENNEAANKLYVDTAVTTALTNYVSADSVIPASGVTGTAIGTVGGVTLYAPTSEEQVYNVDINLDMEYQSGQFINDDSFSSIKQKIEDGVCVVARLYESGNLFQELTVANLSDYSIEFHSPYGYGISGVTELGVCTLTLSDNNSIDYFVQSLNDIYNWENISGKPDLNALTPYVRKDAVVSTGPTTGTEIATISGVTIYAPAALTPYYMEWNETVNAEEAYAAYEAGRPIYLRGAGYEVPEGDLALTSVTTYNGGENTTAYYFLFEKSLSSQQQVYGYDSVSGWTKTISYPVQPSQVNPVAGVTGTAIATIAGKTIYAPVAQGGIQTETDPVFNASAAAGITTADITHWNNIIYYAPIEIDDSIRPMSVNGDNIASRSQSVYMFVNPDDTFTSIKQRLDNRELVVLTYQDEETDDAKYNYAYPVSNTYVDEEKILFIAHEISHDAIFELTSSVLSKDTKLVELSSLESGVLTSVAGVYNTGITVCTIYGTLQGSSNEQEYAVKIPQPDWTQANTTAVDFIKNKPTIPTAVSQLTNDSNFIPYGGVTVTRPDTMPSSNLFGIAVVDGKTIVIPRDSTKSIGTDGNNTRYRITSLNNVTYTVPAYTTVITHDDQVTTKKYVDDKVGELDPYIINYGDEVDMDAVVAAYEAGARIAVHPPYEGPLDQYVDLSYISYGATSGQNYLSFIGNFDELNWRGSDNSWSMISIRHSEYLTSSSVVPALTTGVVIGSIGGVDMYAPMAGEAPDLSGYVPSTRTVNGKALTTNITLTYSDVGAASTAVATTTTSGLLSSSDKIKLNGIQSGAEANVQADWSVTTTTSDAFIKNKPTVTYDSTNRALVLTGF